MLFAHAVPATLSNGVNRLLVKGLMDEGSDTTYVNKDIVEQLGLKWRRNGTFMSTTSQIALECVNGTVDTNISKDLWWSEARQLH